MAAHDDSHYGMEGTEICIFSTRPKPNHGARYLSLGVDSDSRNRKMNPSITPCFPQSVKITILAKYCGKLRNVNV
jgi:hypothetical protein